jgi:hypothetical protein
MAFYRTMDPRFRLRADIHVSLPGGIDMAEAKTGEAFITHEFDEAIAIQQAIVAAEEELGASHPRAESKRLINGALREDEKFLKQLQKLGMPHGATGKAEEVAGALETLMEGTTHKASEAQSEAYEAHAVLVNLKRKQQDSGAAMVKIARAMKDTELREAATDFARAMKTSAQELADELALFAVDIAKAGEPRPAARR